MVPGLGCSLIKQSNTTHHAIEDQNYDVDKVVVKVKNGHKKVVVFLLRKADEAGISDIKAIVMQEIPDAEKVRVRNP